MGGWVGEWMREAPGGVLTIRRLLHMLRHFDPPFSGLRKICIVSTPIFEQKWGKCRISTPIFHQILAKCIVSTPPFWPFVAFGVNRRCWATLSETRPSSPPGGRQRNEVCFRYVHAKGVVIYAAHNSELICFFIIPGPFNMAVIYQ